MAAQQPPSPVQPDAGDRLDTDRLRRVADGETVQRDELDQRPLALRQAIERPAQDTCLRLGVDTLVEQREIVLLHQRAPREAAGCPQLPAATASLGRDDVARDAIEPGDRIAATAPVRVRRVDRGQEDVCGQVRIVDTASDEALHLLHMRAVEGFERIRVVGDPCHVADCPWVGDQRASSQSSRSHPLLDEGARCVTSNA